MTTLLRSTGERPKAGANIDGIWQASMNNCLTDLPLLRSEPKGPNYMIQGGRSLPPLWAALVYDSPRCGNDLLSIPSP